MHRSQQGQDGVLARADPSTARWLHLTDRALAWALWGVLGAGLAVSAVTTAVSTYERSQAVLLTCLSAFFIVLILRLGVAARVARTRRVPLLLVLGAVVVWSLGSISVNAASLAAQRTFPAPGEWLFLASYLGLAAFLLTDARRRPVRASRSWLDVAVISGAVFSLTSLLLVTPISIASGAQGLPLLLALIYPVADMALVLLVLSQTLLQSRTDARTTTMLVMAFLLLAGADSTFALQVSTPTYHFDTLSNALWGAAWALLVTAACRGEQRAVRAERTAPRQVGSLPLVTAGTVALAVLIIRPDDVLAVYTVPPAVLTMLSVGARMVLALRDANRATEAFALSQTDDLTNLPNRRAVRNHLKRALRRHDPLALMLLDLDGFKEINDALGHHAGDTVLSHVGMRMRTAVGNAGVVARLGGDEFAVLLDRVGEADLLATADRILREVARPIVIDDIEIAPSGSIGIAAARASDDDTDGGDVLRRADVAMYQAKASRAGAALYDAHLDEFSRSRLEMTEDLRKGIANDQIEVWYQPQVDASSRAVYALEALVRWRHPRRGLLAPADFLPTARRAGLMGALSEVIATQAVGDLRRLLDDGLDLRLAINCSPSELLGQSYLPRLYDDLLTWDVSADRIILEVTEESFLADPQRAREVLLDVREHDIQISIDDYGTGFSSLTYLRNLPVQELKLDRTLVADVSTNERSRMIVASTIQLAHALDMRTVAEGVENAVDMETLIELGIDSLQGYHLSRPLPIADVEAWMQGES